MMNKKEILKKAGGILAELNEQYEYLSKSSENLNELELELFSANANFLSDHLSILVKLNDSSAKSESRHSKSDPPNANGHPELPKDDAQAITASENSTTEDDVSPDWKFELDKESGITFDFEEKQTDKLFDRPLTEEEKMVIDEKTRLKTVNESEKEYIDFEEQGDEEQQNDEDILMKPNEEVNDVHVKEVVISERTIVVPSEQIPDANQVPTVNDLLSKNISQQTVASQFNSRQNKDLKGMISLNDKLLFVRDLFNGYSLAYSEAVELLNRFDNFEAADNFLKQNYSAKNNWAGKQDVADKFYEILNRRFSK